MSHSLSSLSALRLLFQQLNLYGFCRVTRGPQKGSYLHDKFQRDRPDLGQDIARKKVGPDEASGRDCEDDGGEPDDSVLLVPSWLPEETLDILQPTPLAEMKLAAAAAEESSPAAGADVVRPQPHNSMMDAFESYFQSNVAIVQHHNNKNDADLSKPKGNALKRILDQIIEPEGATDARLHHHSSAHHHHHYHDGNHDDNSSTNSSSDENDHSSMKRTPRCAIFPNKLHDMLDHCEANRLQHIASWEMHGRAFKISSIDLFLKELMPRFFKLTKFESLQRQLNLYGFSRIARGNYKGCYHHPLFVKGGRDLSKDMQRRKPEDIVMVPAGASLASALASRVANSSSTSHNDNQTNSSSSNKRYRDSRQYDINGDKKEETPTISTIGDLARKTKPILQRGPSSRTEMRLPMIKLQDFDKGPQDDDDEPLDAMARDCTEDDSPEDDSPDDVADVMSSVPGIEFATVSSTPFFARPSNAAIAMRFGSLTPPSAGGSMPDNCILATTPAVGPCMFQSESSSATPPDVTLVASMMMASATAPTNMALSSPSPATTSIISNDCSYSFWRTSSIKSGDSDDAVMPMSTSLSSSSNNNNNSIGGMWAFGFVPTTFTSSY